MVGGGGGVLAIRGDFAGGLEEVVDLLRAVPREPAVHHLDGHLFHPRRGASVLGLAFVYDHAII